MIRGYTFIDKIECLTSLFINYNELLHLNKKSH